MPEKCYHLSIKWNTEKLVLCSLKVIVSETLPECSVCLLNAVSSPFTWCLEICRIQICNNLFTFYHLHLIKLLKVFWITHLLRSLESLWMWCCVRWLVLSVLSNRSAFIFTTNHSRNNCLTLKMKAAQSFKTSWTTHPVTQHCITEDLNLQQHCFVNLMSCLFVMVLIFRNNLRLTVVPTADMCVITDCRGTI